MFPDKYGLLINICDLKLAARDESGHIASDSNKPGDTRIILHTCKLGPYELLFLVHHLWLAIGICMEYMFYKYTYFHIPVLSSP